MAIASLLSGITIALVSQCPVTATLDLGAEAYQSPAEDPALAIDGAVVVLAGGHDAVIARRVDDRLVVEARIDGNPPCPDLDESGDGIGFVDARDLFLLLWYWNHDDLLGDVNGDGAVGILDLLKLLASFGPCPWVHHVDAVAASGDRIAFGRAYPGEAVVMRFDGASWAEEARLAPPLPQPPESFGLVLALDGDVLVVGAPLIGPGGAAFVYRFDGSSWNQEAELTAPVPADGDRFGGAVAADGDTIVVGAPGFAANRGGVFIFERRGRHWAPAAELTVADTTIDEHFGHAVALDGTVAVAASLEWIDPNASHVAHVYRRGANQWKAEAELRAPSNTSLFQYARSLDVDEGRIIFGTWDECSCDAGQALVYAHDGGSWRPTAEITVPLGPHDDGFGMEVGLSGSWLFTGARLWSDATPMTVRGYLFDLESCEP